MSVAYDRRTRLRRWNQIVNESHERSLERELDHDLISTRSSLPTLIPAATVPSSSSSSSSSSSTTKATNTTNEWNVEEWNDVYRLTHQMIVPVLLLADREGQTTNEYYVTTTFPSTLGDIRRQWPVEMYNDQYHYCQIRYPIITRYGWPTIPLCTSSTARAYSYPPRLLLMDLMSSILGCTCDDIVASAEAIGSQLYRYLSDLIQEVHLLRYGGMRLIAHTGYHGSYITLWVPPSSNSVSLVTTTETPQTVTGRRSFVDIGSIVYTINHRADSIRITNDTNEMNSVMHINGHLYDIRTGTPLLFRRLNNQTGDMTSISIRSMTTLPYHHASSPMATMMIRSPTIIIRDEEVPGLLFYDYNDFINITNDSYDDSKDRNRNVSTDQMIAGSIDIGALPFHRIQPTHKDNENDLRLLSPPQRVSYNQRITNPGYDEVLSINALGSQISNNSNNITKYVTTATTTTTKMDPPLTTQTSKGLVDMKQHKQEHGNSDHNNEKENTKSNDCKPIGWLIHYIDKTRRLHDYEGQTVYTFAEPSSTYSNYHLLSGMYIPIFVHTTQRHKHIKYHMICH
jgi:hypothetical protein